MLRKLALIMLPVALLAAACSGGNEADDAAQAKPTSEPPAALRDTAVTEKEGGAGEVLFSTLNPFQFLGGIGGQPTSQEVDSSLKGALLDADDLPAEFVSMGEFTFSMPSEYGAMEMAASQFASGDLTTGDFGAMVMSVVLALPPEAIDELGDLGDLSELDELTEADLDEMEAEAERFGMDFGDLRVLDASGLGDGGFGMHMEMDFGGLFEAFGAPEGDNPLAAGIAMDMYMFLRGERVLMAMVMWPADGSPGVDGRSLAETMDGKAAAGL